MNHPQEESHELVDPRRHYIKLWRDKFQAIAGREPTLDWGAMMKAMHRRFEPVDDKTGEIFVDNYPSEEDWISETEGFFRDKYWKERNFFFGSFLKHFGQFTSIRRKDGTIKRAEPMPIPEVVKLFDRIAEPMSSVHKATDANEKFRCDECGGLFKNIAEHRKEHNP